MLYNIDARLGPELLHALASMGHGDCIAIVDENFPAAATAAHCVRPSPLQIDAATTAEAVRVLAAIMPLEEGRLASGYFMRNDDSPDDPPPVVTEVMTAVKELQSVAGPVEGLQRHAFYEAGRRCFAVVRTRERRFYGSIILKKGVIHPGQ
jgi:L-fucose mutarotase